MQTAVTDHNISALKNEAHGATTGWTAAEAEKMLGEPFIRLPRKNFLRSADG